MNNKNLWIAILSGGALTTLVSNVPGLDMINLALCAGFWGGAIFAVWLYKRLNGSLDRRQARRIGLLSGIVAGVLGFALSFAGLAGLQGLLNEAQLFSGDTGGMSDVPLWGALLFNLVGVGVTIAFGALGGWLGGIFFVPSPKPQTGQPAS